MTGGVFLFVSRMTLVEPGPVTTEFERKVYQEAAEKGMGEEGVGVGG